MTQSYSADVQMWLECGEYGTLELIRIAPRFVFAKTPRDIPPCVAELVVTVDGRCTRRQVRLAAGVSSERENALALPVDSIPF